jgi:hypothetical protein
VEQSVEIGKRKGGGEKSRKSFRSETVVGMTKTETLNSTGVVWDQVLNFYPSTQEQRVSQQVYSMRLYDFVSDYCPICIQMEW